MVVDLFSFKNFGPLVNQAQEWNSLSDMNKCQNMVNFLKKSFEKLFVDSHNLVLVCFTIVVWMWLTVLL